MSADAPADAVPAAEVEKEASPSSPDKEPPKQSEGTAKPPESAAVPESATDSGAMASTPQAPLDAQAAKTEPVKSPEPKSAAVDDNKLTETNATASGPVSTPAPPPAPASTPEPATAPKASEKKDTNTAATATEDPAADNQKAPLAIVASSKKSRPPYKYDPDKITLRFLFANRDGLTVTVECKPGDTVGEVKGALMSVWPDDLPNCEGGELLRLVCMGKGFLMPDSRTLEDCQIPVFKTHPTPVNVSVKPNLKGSGGDATSKSGGPSGGDGTSGNGSNNGAEQTGQGCACAIL